MEHAELRGEVVVVDEAVDHLHALGFHGVLLAELVFCDVFVVEVADLAHRNNNNKNNKAAKIAQQVMVNLYMGWE